MTVVRRFSAIFVAGALCVVVLLATIWNLGLDPVDQRLTGSPADDPARIFGQLGLQLEADSAVVSPSYRSEVRSAAQRAPLSDEPFLIEALVSRSEGRFHEAMERLEQARRRDPRNRLTRIMLFEAYLHQARAGQVVEEAAALYRLGTGSTQAILPILANLVENPSTRKAAVEALQASVLFYPVLRTLAEREVNPELLISLAGAPVDLKQFSDDTRQQINGLSAPYIKSGKWSQAADLWAHFYRQQPAKLSQVIDPEFSGKLGPPFGWQLGRSDGGLVEQADNGLHIVDFGRKSWEVARQLLLIRPGTYRLSYELDDETANLPDLAWRVDCDGGGETLLELPFRRENLLGLAASDNFTVPADGCSAQWLSLVSTGSGSGQTRSIVIRSVTITQRRED